MECWTFSSGIAWQSRVPSLVSVAQVVGVITRKDIAEANAKLALGRKANLGLTTASEQLVAPGGLPFIPYEAYDPTVLRSSQQLAAIDDSGASPLKPNAPPELGSANELNVSGQGI